MAKTTNLNEKTRLISFKNDLSKKPELQTKFEKLYNEKKGDWPAINKALKKNKSFSAAVVNNLSFTNELGNWTGDNETLVSLFQNKKETNSMRDIALTINRKDFKKLITGGAAIPKGETKIAYADRLYNELYAKEPTAVIVNMIKDPKVPFLNDAIGSEVASVLEKQLEFNIKTTSIYELFKKKDSFEDIPAESHEAVKTQLKNLQRIIAVSPVSDAVPVLLKAKLHTAFQISEIPPTQFTTMMDGKGLDNKTLTQIHSNAQQARVRNEQTLMALREVRQGTGIAMIDKSLSVGDDVNTGRSLLKTKENPYSFDQVTKEAIDEHNLSWDLLFGDADFCECGECNSVYSASAYFVELLQYLRNNDLDPNATGPLKIKSDPKDISGTPLEKLFERRSDLGCLELTCKNTNTILPYVDLVNEVMEQYVAHKITKAFNVADETSGELLSAPQHTEQEYAYQTLKDTVYPFTLPYHQPIDAERIYLNHLDTSRYEVTRTFRINNSGKFARLKDEALDRAVDAEYLGLTKEEYVILTKESFESKALMDKLKHKTHTAAKYRELIGVRPVYEYYGFENAGSMLGDTGLTLIKKEFLLRTGIDYFNLVDILKTAYLNPSIPKGKSRVIMESLRFSYRFLQSYAKIHGVDKMAEYLTTLEKFATLFPKVLICPNSSQEQPEITSKDIIHWVKCHFENIGKIIVIESGIGCVNGKILLNQQTVSGDNANRQLVVENCIISYGVGVEKKLLSRIDKKTGKVTLTNPQNGSNVDDYKNYSFIGDRGEKGIFVVIGNEVYLILLEQKDSCDLDTALLQHLDGTSLTVEEYDRIHRFIRLWHKLGWTIDEIDKAIVGLSTEKLQKDDPGDLKEDSSCDDNTEEDSIDTINDKGECEELRKVTHHYDINPILIHQLVPVRKLLERTGMELVKLLSLWTDISTEGEASLYQHLFLTHNLLGIDKVFKAVNGNYLNGDAKISEHIPVLMAAFNLSADDIEAIRIATSMDDKIVISNLSILYRYRLLSKVLGLRIPAFITILPLFGDVFRNAHATLEFIEQWAKMEDAGFTPEHLNYIIRDVDDEKKPFASSQKAIVQLTKILFDGLNSIENSHPDMKADGTIVEPGLKKINIQEQATSELLRTKASLLFDSSIVEQTIGLLEGTNVFTTNAPVNLTFTTAGEKLLKEKLQNKLKYDKTEGTIQITGILTEGEIINFQNISNDTDWSKALTRIPKQQKKQFKVLLSGVFENEKTLADTRKEELEEIIKAADLIIPLDQILPGQTDPNTAPVKRAAFLEIYLPYLRQELTHRFIIDALSNFAGLETKMTDVLVSEVLKLNTPAEAIYNIFEKIKESSKPTESNWSGYLIPGAETTYTLIVKNSNTNPVISLDGYVLNSFNAQEDPTNEWWSANLKLQPGKLYKLTTTGVELKNIYWKTPASDIFPIPSSALIPDFASKQCEPALIALKKAAILVSTFNLSPDEIRFLDFNKADYDDLDFNRLTLIHWLRIEAYTRLRNSMPQTKLDLLTFWNWVFNAPGTAILSEKIAELTNWKIEHIDHLISNDHFNISKLEDYRNEKNLLKLHEALTVSAKTGMDISKLFEWAVPSSDFNDCKTIADSIQNTVRALYNQTDWEQVAKPLNDLLRNNQKDALIAYLLQQKELKDANVTDVDGLFEYFLIDVQMDACMETSRIKQAISSVQLFIQRCFLGLEKDNDIPPSLLDRKRWESLQRYRVSEANRKVFLYPENWIESNLRDDKSPFFKELESELLQKDINKQNVTDALKTYLYKVDEVANMEVIGLYIEERKKLHVFSRTRNAPYFSFYRYLDIEAGNWYPWEKMQIDIPSYDKEEVTEVIKENNTYKSNPDYKKIIGNGCYLTPIVWNDRLLIFFPQFMRKTKPNDDVANSKSIKDISEDSTNSSRAIEYWEIKMAWSEYRNGKWTQKQLSKEAIYDIPAVSGFWQVFNAASKVMNRSVAAQSEYEIKNRAAWRRRNKWTSKSQEQQNLKKTAASDAEWAAWDQLVIDEQLAWDDYKVAWDKEIEAKSNADDAAAEIVVNAAVIQLKTLPAPPPASDISKYEFVPVISAADNLLEIKLYYNQTDSIIPRNVFKFDGSNITSTTDNSSENISINVARFHHDSSNNSSLIKSLQRSNNVNNADDYKFDDRINTTYISPNKTINFHHSDVHKLLGIINAQQLDIFFKYNINNIADKADAFGNYDNDENPNTPDIYHELKRPYSLYNWELFFHTPIMVADALSKAQQFEEAMKWFHYVFYPIADGVDDNRFWQFAPFKEINSKRILDSIFNNLKPNTKNDAINEWRNKPFMPHVVARNRPVAYMKYVVMKYIDNILDWGDYLFRQDTIESINQATQLYILALHILGPRPMMIPKRGKTRPQTYLGLLNKWDAFGNAIVELELVLPFSNQTILPLGAVNGGIAFANIFGLSTSSYFCIPNNPKLTGYWDTLADRLFKIRHCQNIEGVFRKLPLFEPPIDPALLVKAAAQGLSISSVVNDLNTAMPNYRFYYLLQKALELCNELKSLGGAMLSAIEKKDNESISLIRARHEGTMTNLMMEIKKLQLEESQKSLESLYQNRKSPETRMKYYLQLIGEDVNKIPGIDSDFAELTNSIEKPMDESGLHLSKYEKEDMDKANLAADLQLAAGITETLAGILYAIPMIKADVAPMGIGAGVAFGGTNLGQLTQAVTKVMQLTAGHLSHQSASAAKKGSFQRALQDRIMQANTAGYELKQIDKLITTQQIRINITNQEITNQQKQIDNANEVEEFLKNKYTNEELYVWMKGNLKALYHQVYNLAYDLAKKAEKTYCFERGISNTNFIQSGYYDAGRDGLLAGEQLYVGLKQLEAAHQEKRGYDYEITKHVSLRQLDPLALLQLKAAGKCEFELSEVLFDMDYPGHFKRRIKSVSVSIPCIAGPYTGVNTTLRLLINKFRNSSIANNYPEKTNEQDDRFISYNIPITAIATSSAQNDSGLFELNFKDERYLPFEGAGVISRWRLELPSIKQFDYYSISDVVLHLKYFASEGGGQLKNSATETVKNFIKATTELSEHEGLFTLIDLKHDMSNEWNLLKKFLSVDLKIEKSRLPYMAQMINSTVIENVMFIVKVEGDPNTFSINVNGTGSILSKINDDVKLCKGVISTIQLGVEFPLSLAQTELDKLEELILVVRFKF